MKAVRRDRMAGFVFTAGVFLFFVLFFTKLYPIVISTTDDYYGVFNHRQALPQWRGSEPIRVIGAVFLPMVSQIMAWFYRVFGGNLFDYLTFGWAVCVAGAIAGLIAVMYRMLRKGFPVGKLIVPLLLVVILVDCNSMGRTYKDSVSDGRHETYATHNRINQDILSQLQEAEAAGLKETKLYIPDYNTFDNWPYAVYAGEPISKGFYKLGALGEEIRITEIVPSTEKNRELGIGEP